MTDRPDVQLQNPLINHCIVNHIELGWLSCTAYGIAMLVDRSTLGQRQPSGCAIRRATGDTSGGTRLVQCTMAAQELYPHDERVSAIVLRTGANVAKPEQVGRWLKQGRGVTAQGNTGPLVGTKFKSTNGPVNHCVYVNEGRDFDGDIPAEVLVFDPAADGRRDMDDSPSWWPWSLFLKFCAALEPNGEGSGHLGPGRIYCAYGPDTEPHLTLRFGAKAIPPKGYFARDLPGSRLVAVRDRPSTTGRVVQRLHPGDRFGAWQLKTWEDDSAAHAPGGVHRWFGNILGDHWVNLSGVDH